MADFLDIDSRHAGQEIDRAFFVGQETEFVFGQGTAIFSRAPVAIYGMTQARVVSDAGEKWFEFGFRVDMTSMGGGLTGNGATGWTDPGNYLRLEPQWSPDLINWSMGKFLPAPVPFVDLGDDVHEYWSRAIHPQDSQIKTGALFFSNTSADSRVNGFTSLIIAGVALALPNFPYNMAVAGKSAQLQADIRAAGYPSAIVTGTTALNWTISIPSVNYTSYAQSSWVGFPGFLVDDMFGALTITVNSSYAVGTFVDPAGTPIFQKAFGRLKITAGTRYDPYLLQL